MLHDAAFYECSAIEDLVAEAERDEQLARPAGLTNLPDAFWRSRPALDHVRRAAWNRTRSPDAVLAGVLARVAVLTPPSVRLPAIVGGEGSLDLIAAVVAPSGAGKSSSVSTARDLVPIVDESVLLDVPIGSGEGLIDAYLGAVNDVDEDGKPIKVRRQVRDSVLALVDEGQVLTEIASRRGSVLMPTLRSMWSGSTVGQANASVETRRRLDAGSYRLAAIISLQPEHGAAILDDAAGGTPQRLLWLSGVDPSIPDIAPSWPGPLGFTRPPSFSHAPHMLDVEPNVAADIRRRGLARARGEATDDPLDAHRDLLRLKVAALLGILDDRLGVNADDWNLAGQVVRTSSIVRSVVAEHARQQARQRDDAATDRAIRRELTIADTVEQRALTAAARAIGRRVHKSGDDIVKRRFLTQAVAGKHRELVSIDDAIAHALAEGWIEPAEDGYRKGRSQPS